MHQLIQTKRNSQRLINCIKIIVMDAKVISSEERSRCAKKVTWVGFIVNVILSLLKIISGIIGHSGAMIADGIHSISDFVTDVIVLVFIGVSSRGENEKYQYGHGKFETFATMLISFALLAVAIGLFISSAEAIWMAINGAILPKPGIIAFVMAIISIISKEWLFQYTKNTGEKIHSMALIANAWHHRSDAFSSIAVLIGIGCSIFLGEGWRILDPIAALIVSIFIAIVSLRIGLPSINELLEVSLPESVNKEIGEVISGVAGVKTFHRLRTRKNGSTVVMGFHIKVDPKMTIVEAHDVANNTEQALRRKFGAGTIINIHIEPYYEKDSTKPQ